MLPPGPVQARACRRPAESPHTRKELSVSFMSWLRNLLSPEAKGQQAVELGRNEPCWCGSGKKYKKCHLTSDEANHREAKIVSRVAAARREQAGIVPSTPKKAGGKARPAEWKGGADAARR
jgi:hypothetical protein